MISEITAHLEHSTAQEIFRLNPTQYGVHAVAQALAVGFGVDRDEASAFELIQALASEWHIPALADLGRCYWFGHGVTPDPDAARAWFTLGAEAGDMEATADLIRLLSLYREDEAAQAEAVGWGLRLMSEHADLADSIRDCLPDALAELSESQIDAACRTHGRKTLH